MNDLVNSLLRQSPALPAALVQGHVRRMPESYFDNYSPVEIGHHLRLLAGLSGDKQVDVDVRPLGARSFEICVAGFDHTGALAAITTALASDGLDTLDLRLATYHSEEDDAPGSALFVDVARVRAMRPGATKSQLAEGLRERLKIAFGYLAEGDVMKAQSAAGDSGSSVIGKVRGSRSSSDAWVVKRGLTLGDFRLESPLAAGGMGEVYLATQLSLSRKTAVKIMTSRATRADDLGVGRFQKEGAVLGSFACPHIVQVLACGATNVADGRVLRWLAMEYLPGGDVATRVRGHGPPPSGLAGRWLLEALQGLHYAHQRGILHRDVKPHNLLLTNDQHAKLTDFGLLKDAHQPAMDMTMAGAVMGTPQYISPEQALGDGVDERSDLFSLGVSFFHILSGRPTFEEKTAAAMLVRVSQHQAPPLLEAAPGVPRPLALVIDRMAALRPEDRYQDARVAIEDLNSYVQRGRLTLAPEELPNEQPTPSLPPIEQTQISIT